MLYFFARGARLLYFFIAGSCLLFLLLSSYTANAEDGKSFGHALSDRIAAAHRSGAAFSEVNLFVVTGGNHHADLLETETILRPETVAVTALFKAHPQAISLKMRTEDGKVYTLEMLRAHPLAESPNLGIIDASGRHAVAANAGIHYQGSVVGTQQSFAALSVFANGEVMLLFANEEGNFVCGKIADGTGNYILYNDRNMRNRPAMPCGVKENDVKATAAGRGTRAYGCNKVRVYWEVANNLFINKGSLVNTQNYVVGLFNQFQALYANEQIAMELKSMYVWTVPDNYPTTSSSPALEKFKTFWNAMNDGFDGDIAHLLTRDNAGNGGGNGGLGYLDALCNRNYAYSYSDIYGTYQNLPTYSWDVTVISHETGHNLGSKHTHWCGWNTGTGGTCGSIDNCATQETATGCSTCGQTFSNSASTTAWKGTVMSYCHLVARGVNLANGFGPLPGALIRDNIGNASCLNNILSAKLTPVTSCIATGGSINLAFDTSNFGTSPYTYSWTGGLHTQNATNLNPGNYTVDVRDSNGCTFSFSAALLPMPASGNGIAPVVPMPVCCQNTSRIIALTATAPTYRNSCETVYWLRTNVPVTTYAALKQAVDTAQAANILASTTPTNQQNPVAATLDVHPPATCTGPVSYYYTPFVGRAAISTYNNSITATSGGAFLSASATIGARAILAGQTIPDCNLLDTPTLQNLTISVSSYTGRANNMSLMIQDYAYNVIYTNFGLSGNGNYIIPAAAIRGAFNGRMIISAFDYNCATTVNCIASTLNITASRTINYAAHALSMDSSCVAGTSVKIDFAPSGCTNLAIGNATQQLHPTLYPNPATQSATLAFHAVSAGSMQLKVTDIIGKTVLVQQLSYTTGDQQLVMDTHQWAKGVYVVTLSGSEGAAGSLKLIIK